MARDQEVIHVPRGQVVELTNADVSAISFAVLYGAIEIVAMPDDTPPAATARGWPFRQGSGLLRHPLSDLRATSCTRVFAIGTAAPTAIVLVDHA